MAEVTLGGNPVHTVGELPTVGSPAPAFTLAGGDLSDVTPETFVGRKVVLNIFPSVGTGVCASSVRAFNSRAAALDNTTILCVSADLPFAQASFCAAEGIDNVVMASSFRSDFGDVYGVRLLDGKFIGLLARSVVVVDESGTGIHSQLVPEIGQEPDYDAALASLD